MQRNYFPVPEVIGEGERRGKHVGLIGRGKVLGDLEWLWGELVTLGGDPPPE